MAGSNYKKTIRMPVLVRTEILINATPEKIWLILSNFDNYPN